MVVTSKGKIIWLLIVSLFFIIAGFAVISSTFNTTFGSDACVVNGKQYSDGERVLGYKEGADCTCANGKVICTEIAQTGKDTNLEVDDFTRDNLQFSAKYITTGMSSEVEFAPLKTVFRSISSQENEVEVVIEQGQLCTVDREAPVQIGMYHASKDSLTLLMVVNSIASIYTEPCTVQATFNISKLKSDIKDGYSLQYRSENGELLRANACIYNEKIFNNGDNYKAVDGCNICNCDNGISRCSNDRVCSLKDDPKEDSK